MAKTKKISKAERERREAQSKASTKVRVNPMAVHGSSNSDGWEYLEHGVSDPAYNGPGRMDGFALVNWVLIKAIGTITASVVGMGQAVKYHNIIIPTTTKEQKANLPSQPNFKKHGVTPYGG